MNSPDACPDSSRRPSALSFVCGVRALRHFGRVGVFLLCLVLVGAPATGVAVEGTEMDLSLDIQSVLFQKILRYDYTLQERESFKVMVVYGTESAQLTQKITSAFAKAEISAEAIKASAIGEELGTGLSPGDVVYLLPSAISPAMKELCREHSLLSITAFPSLVESGDSAVGVGLWNGRPQIFVNVARMKNDGHQLSADLLKLSRVVR